MNNELIEQMKAAIVDGLVTMKPNAAGDRFVLCYSHHATNGHIWTEATRAARSMVVDKDLNVISPCIPKFFNNFTDAAKDMREFRVFEKLDGSIIYVYFDKEKQEWITRSKSSFTSDVAIAADAWLRASGLLEDLPEHLTYCFEWISPSNPIVVDYGDREELVLLCAIDNTTTAQYIPYAVWEWKGSVPRTLEFTRNATAEDDVIALKALVAKGDEGWILWEHGTNIRAKIKTEDYLKIHRLRSTMNAERIREYVFNYTDEEREQVEVVLRGLSPEIVDRFWATADAMVLEGRNLKREIDAAFATVKHITDRREFALATEPFGQPIRGALFMLRDGRDPYQYIVKHIDPKKFEGIQVFSKAKDESERVPATA